MRRRRRRRRRRWSHLSDSAPPRSRADIVLIVEVV
jgi:hypothetical protein